jgi:hypothetical protein
VQGRNKNIKENQYKDEGERGSGKEPGGADFPPLPESG